MSPSPLLSVAAKLDIPPDAVEMYGRDAAKINLSALSPSSSGQTRPPGRLILVTAINPTPAGEGKTTTSIGLADALSLLDQRVTLCLREPSLGPCFGLKGGATGGGKARLVPSAEINLHFTGDFHAITTTHNLIAALLDNALHHGTLKDVDPKRLTWRRTMDMNDRALRRITVGLGPSSDGVMRESGFDITPASEVMAVFCLATDQDDLRLRLDRIVLGWRGKDREPVCVRDLQATGALVALLKEALKPNLVRTLEGTPAFVHGGPFGNIAHGCNSLIATRAALSLADWVVTEAGFGADLGAEKFLDIKCRAGGLSPAVAVLVATVRALKYNGGVAVPDLGTENIPALEAGIPNLLRHAANLELYGLPVVVALNRFDTDTDTEIQTVQAWCRRNRLTCVPATHFTDGGAGATDLARAVMTASASASPLRFLYPDSLPLLDKIRTIAQRIYHARDVSFSADALRAADRFERAGYGALPVCVAKTQYSFSDDPTLLGAPQGFTARVRDLRLSAGAGFVVALMGDVMLMPGLPAHPASAEIDVDATTGAITGLG